MATRSIQADRTGPATGAPAASAGQPDVPPLPRRRTIVVPPVADVVFIAIAAFVPTVYFDRLMFSDGDMLRHVRLGEWMIQHRALLTVDPFSFTRPGAPFTPYEWLSEVVFGALHLAGGLPAVALGAAALIAATYALLFRWMVRRGVGRWTALGAIGYAIVLGSIHWLARPHLFTLLGCVALLWLMAYRIRLPFLAGVLLFALWVNLHSGAFLGLTLVGAIAAGEALDLLVGATPLFPGRTRQIALLLAGGAVGLMITPQGPGLVLHAVRTLGDPVLIDNTEEFLSPNFHTFWAKAFLGGVLAIAALFALKRERPPMAALAVFLLFAATGAIYRRNVPFFGLVAVPLLLAWPALHRSIPSIPRLVRVLRDGDRMARPAVWSGAFALGMLALAAAGGAIGPLQLVRARVSPTRFPVAAVAFARAHHVTGRMFHDQVWGGYVLYAWPEQRVYIDGATDFYGPAIAREYMQVMGLADGWEQKLAARRIQLALLPAKIPLATTLERYARWRPLYRDSVAVLLRSPAAGAGDAR